MDNRSTPYIALAWGIYEEQEDPIKFATEHLEQINNSALSGPLVKISKVYQALEIYSDQLGAQPVITLPQLTELYALAKTIGDDKTAKAVLISLAARHLSFKNGISHCQQCHIDDAKNIIASTITYFKQEATVDAMVYMVNCLCKKPSDYQFASTQGQKAEAKKLAGNRLFSKQHKEQIDRIRLLLIAAQNISLQVEDKQLDDSYILFSVKQGLLKQGVDEKLANAIAIVTGSSYFLEDPSRIPTAIALEKAAEWLVKSEALINYQANQVSIIKFLQEYFKRNNNSDVVKALATAQALKEDVLLGNSIEGKLKSQGKIAERSWKAFLLIQEYVAKYYFSPTYGGFKINCDDNQGNGFYHAILTVLKVAFKDDVDHAIHKLTKNNLSQLIKELLPISKGIIVEHFSNIIRGKDNLLSVPNALTEELNLLQSAWLQRNHLSATSIEILDRDLNNYLETISSRYIEFVNRNPEIGCAIELKIIAHYYEVQIQQHSYLVDNLNVINNNTSKIVHILYAPYQSKYYGLSHQELTASSELSIVDYVKQAVGAVAYIQEPLDFWSLASTVSILAMHSPIVWQANNLDIDVALLKQTIQDAYNETKEACLDNCIKRHEQVFKKTASSKPNIPDEVKEIKRDLSLSSMPREQLALIELEAAYSIADLKWAAVNKAHSNAKTAKPYTMTEEMLVALRKKDEAKIALVEERQIVNNSRYNRAVIDHYEAMFLEELRLRNVAKIEAYTAWWQNLIKEQRNSIETALAEYNKQIDASIQQLTTTYEQQMTVINRHYDDVTHKTIKAYCEYERQVEDERRKARRKRRRKIIKTFVSMGIAAFVAPVLAQSMFSAGFGCTVATGVIAGGISSGIAGNNILKGAATGGLFAGFGSAFDNILGEFIKNSDLLKDSFNIAATASLSTAIHGGKLLDNILASVGANVVASLAIPLPKTNLNQALTKQQLTFIVNRKVAREFTKGMFSSVVTKNPNLGMSLMMSGMGALQSWVGHQANTFVQERRVNKQLQRISHPRPAIGFNRQNSNSRYTFIPHTSKTNKAKPSTTNSVSSPKPRADRSRLSPVAENQNQALSLSQIYSTKNDSFWSNFNDYLNTYAPTAQTPVQNWKPMFFSDFGNNHKLTPFEGKGGETRYRNVSSPKSRVNDQPQSTNQYSSSTTATKIPQLLATSSQLEEQASSSWRNNDFDLDAMLYSSQSKVILNSYQQYQVGTRAMGAMQAGFGIGQLGLSVALAEIGVGIAPACFLAARGADNLVTGAMGFVTGQDRPTVLHQAVHSVGLSDTAATWIEFGVDLSPSVAPAIARNASHIVNKGILKLYDVGRSKNLRWFEPQYVSTGGFRNELSLTLSQKQEALDYALSLGVPKEAIYFTDNSPTSYKILFGKKEILYIGTDVLPNTSKTSIANSRVTMKGAIAHEIVGHRAAELANMTQSNAILEEAQASIRAARFAEGLADVERTILLRDGIERLRNAGYKVADVKNILWIHESEALKPQLILK